MTTRRTRSQAKKEQTLKQKCQSLYQAVRNRKISEAEEFLKAGAKSDFISLEDNMGFTPFHAALPQYEGKGQPEEKEEQIHIDLLNLLINKKYCKSPEKLNIFTEDCYGMNPFEWAIADSKEKCTHWFLKLLKNKSFKVDSNRIINRQNTLESTLPFEHCKRIKNQSPIQLAVKSESLTIVQELVAFTPKPNVGICNANKMNAIHIAIKRKLPEILHELVQIASTSDLNKRTSNNQTALQYAECIYQNSLKTATLPTDILKAWQTKEIIKHRLSHSLRDEWEHIKTQSEPKYNAVMKFWKFTEEQNPNTNALKPAITNTSNHNSSNIIHNDIHNIIHTQNKEKYRIVSFEEACQLQHTNPNWVTTYNGTLNAKERWIKTQQLSPFAQRFIQLFYQQRQQLQFSYEPSKSQSHSPRSQSPSLGSSSNTMTDSDCEEDMKESECNNNNNNKKRKRKKKAKRLSEPVFLYNNKWICVDAINKELDNELTMQDRIKFYELSIGKYDKNNDIEIREILDPAHPCKRYNQDEPVFGIFATKCLPKKTILLEYLGKVCTKNEYLSSLGSEKFQRFDAQWRIFEFDTLKPTHAHQRENSLLINADYYSNESVFVNDAMHDDIFGKWSTPNVSFFEIVINGLPHAFIRVFEDVSQGDELLASYGSKFWRQYNEDIKIKHALNNYHLMRLQREKEVQVLLNKNKRKQRKRKRNEMENNINHIDNGINDHIIEPQHKRRRLNRNNNNNNYNYNLVQQTTDDINIASLSNNTGLQCIDNKLNQLINEIKNNNESIGNSEFQQLLSEIGKKNSVILQLWIDSTIKHNQIELNNERKFRDRLHEMEKKINEKEERNTILQKKINEYQNNEKERVKKLKEFNRQFPQIIKEANLLCNDNVNKDKEIKRLTDLTAILMSKKQKYKDMCREHNRKRNGEEY